LQARSGVHHLYRQAALTLIIITVCAIIAICSSYQSATSFQKRAPRQQSQIVELQ